MANTTAGLDLLRTITGSVEERTVVQAQNTGTAAVGKAAVNAIGEAAEGKTAVLDKKQELNQQQALVQETYNQFVAGKTQAVQQEIAGTKNVVALQNKAFDEVSSALAALTRDKQGYSFFTNPIATVRNSVKMSNLREQLSDIVTSINAGEAHIDRAYAEGAQELRDYQATVINKSMAELQVQQNEMTDFAQRTQVENDAKAASIAAADKAITSQRSVSDSTDKAAKARDEEFEKSILYRFMYRMRNNGSEQGYDSEQGKLSAQILSQATPEEQQQWTNVAGRVSTPSAPQVVRNDGETEAEVAARQMRADISLLSGTAGAGAVDLIAQAGNSSYNELFSYADAQAKRNILSSVPMLNAKGKPFLPEEIGQAKQLALDNYKKLKPSDKVVYAQQSIEQDITARAANSINAPLYFKGAAEQMAAINAPAPVVEFFQSDEARTAIEVPMPVTGKTNANVALALMKSLSEVTMPNQKPMSDSEKAEIVSKYMKQSYLAEYSQNGEDSQMLNDLYSLRPNLNMKIAIPVTFKNEKNKMYNLADPADVLALTIRAEKTGSTVLRPVNTGVLGGIPATTITTPKLE